MNELLALHASAPKGCGCSDCSIALEACPACYRVWWQGRHPNTNFVCADDSEVFAANQRASAAESAAAELRERADAAERDAVRLDWLERQHVEVRIPLRYGSRQLFHASPDLEEEISDLRSQVDAALTAPSAAGGGK